MPDFKLRRTTSDQEEHLSRGRTRAALVIRGPAETADLGNECAKQVVLNQGPDQHLKGPGQACIFWKISLVIVMWFFPSHNKS